MNHSRITILMLVCTLSLGDFGLFSRFSLYAEVENPAPSAGREIVPPTSEATPEPKAEKTPEPIDPLKSLQRILGGMKLSATLIRKADAESATKTAQTQVVRDLDELIAFLESQAGSDSPPPDSSPPQQPKDQTPDPEESGPQSAPQNSSRPPPSQTESSPQEDQARESGPRRKSPEISRQDKSLSGKRLFEKEVWGHLPPALRRELMNVYSEKYIPQYEDLVRRYYESLAEGNRRRNSSR